MSAADTDSIRMTVSGLTVDPFTNAPILMLKDEDGENAIPIWIGLVEASAIATELEDIEIGRPLTHDLLKSTIDALGGVLDHVDICDLRDATFFANLSIAVGDVVHVVDARPSDAIALALRCGAPIYVARKVVEKSTKLDVDQVAAGIAESKEQWAEILENLAPDDFGKYKM